MRAPAAPRASGSTIKASSLRYLGITGGHLSKGARPRNAAAALSRSFPKPTPPPTAARSQQSGGNDWDTHGDTVGKPIWCVLVRIADDDGREVPLGSEGEVCVRTPLAIQGYYQNPQATEEFLHGGWCHTGDIGFLDSEGYLHISGRKKNMIKSGGISVFPEEIEDTLRRHPAVADAAVVGVKSQEWGEAMQAFVVLHHGAECNAGCVDSILQRIVGSLQSA